MLILYPNNTLEKLEFDKIMLLLSHHCQMADAKQMVKDIRFHTKIGYLKEALLQTEEMKQSISGAVAFPNSFTNDVTSELKMLSIQNAVLSAEQLLTIQKLAINIQAIHQWFKKHLDLYPTILSIIKVVPYDKQISQIIGTILDDNAQIRDTASRELSNIRVQLINARTAQRASFDRALRKCIKNGYLADINEGFLNGRRTLAVLAEHKRIVKGIIHGESDSGKTVFIEPEESIGINNEVGEIERAEQREIRKILQQATAQLKPFKDLLSLYYKTTVQYDFIMAKAKLAIELHANMPEVTPHPSFNLVNAYHPVLLLHNKSVNKKTHPINLSLDRNNRILMISGPNAGGKTVTMKTVGLLQLMVQAGLLIPADPKSEIGIFKQLFVHIGDTQSIENELSTYSAHLKDMKYFAENANGKTLFFIDELGSGSDPHLGGAFAEAIVEVLAQKHALGIITTHYLNLKVMAGKVNGIINGAMTFDEQRLEPLYELELGKPGSSYTFAIAERSRLAANIIERARVLTERDHFKLDKMLHKTEQQSVQLNEQEKKLEKLIAKNQQLKNKYEQLIDKEKLNQHYATLKLQNKIKKEELDYLRDMERKFKQIIVDWKKTDNKQEVIQTAEKILFRKKQIAQNEKAAKKANKSYQAIGRKPEIGDLIRNTQNHQVGTLLEIENKTAKVKIGKMTFTISDLNDNWITVRKRSKKGNG